MVAGRRIVVATTNAGKLREVRAMLTDLPVDLHDLGDFPSLSSPVEDADTFAGNAAIKALHYARLTNCWALADDSGLVVDALDGAPGVHSARYAGSDADDHANNRKLIAALAAVQQDRRTARFCCAIALADPEQILATAAGELRGLIMDQPRGHNGFGYDPHFLLPDRAVTTAELPPVEKNRISHRGQAIRAIRLEIERLVATTPST